MSWEGLVIYQSYSAMSQSLGGDVEEEGCRRKLPRPADVDLGTPKVIPSDSTIAQSWRQNESTRQCPYDYHFLDKSYLQWYLRYLRYSELTRTLKGDIHWERKAPKTRGLGVTWLSSI